MDNVSAKTRSRVMRSVPSVGSSPERKVCDLIRALGYKFRTNDVTLPGAPDIVLRAQRKAIFVHGCFWHQHEGCSGGRLPATRNSYWVPKLLANTFRDAFAIRELHVRGWSVCVVWACELADASNVAKRLGAFLEVTSSAEVKPNGLESSSPFQAVPRDRPKKSACS
jgi:DNA mismatch endonuclease, patch repair protein